MQTALKGCLQLRPPPARAAAVARPRRAWTSRASLDQPSEQARCDAQASVAEALPQTGPRTTKAKAKPAEAPMVLVARSLPRVLILHTGGTLGMQPSESFETDSADGHLHLVPGTGGQYEKALRPSGLLDNLLNVVPELKQFAQLDVKVVFNKDSSNVGPKEWWVLSSGLHGGPAALGSRGAEPLPALLVGSSWRRCCTGSGTHTTRSWSSTALTP